MNVWDRIAVSYCCAVEDTVVTTKTPVSRSLLWYQMKRRRPSTGRETDDSQLEHVLEFVFNSRSGERSLGWAKICVPDVVVLDGRIR